MTFYYDIHSLVSVASDVVLPELAAFATPDAPDGVTLRVRVGRWRRRPPSPGAAETLVYDEGIGGLGFAVRIALGERTEVDASPLLRKSPHVLYSDVVEPILRWAFVRQGWALIRGACVGRGDDAYLVAARTDTGKATTLLTLLRRYPQLSFLGDDRCLVHSNGSVLAYPKPMTISRRTLRAVNPRALSCGERAALMVQTRVHSCSGRRCAHFLTRFGLPTATINTVAQWLIPPPQYPLRRLLRYAGVADAARLRGLFMIERGAAEEVFELDHATAMEMLAVNCEDALGFPPSAALEARLRYQGGRDWRERELEIVGSAFAGLRATLLSSSRFEWWRPIAIAIDRPIARTAPVAAEVAFA